MAQCITARTGCRGDLETESFILETAEPLQPVVGTLAPGAHGSGASTVNGQDAYSGQLVPITVNALTGQLGTGGPDDNHAQAGWLIEQDSNG